MFTLTNGLLMEFHRQIQQLQFGTQNAPPSVLALLFKGRIKEFQEETGAKLETLNKKVNAMQKKYFVFVENELQFSEPIVDKDNKQTSPPMPKLNEGFTREAFDKEMAELMQTQLNINF